MATVGKSLALVLILIMILSSLNLLRLVRAEASPVYSNSVKALRGCYQEKVQATWDRSSRQHPYAIDDYYSCLAKGAFNVEEALRR